MTATRYDNLSNNMALYNQKASNVAQGLAELQVINTLITSDNSFGTAATADEQKFYGTTETNALTAALAAIKPITYTITTSAGANGAVSPTGAVAVNYNSGQTFTATPTALYEVDEWTLDSVSAQTGGDTFTLDPVTADHTLVVTFSLIP